MSIFVTSPQTVTLPVRMYTRRESLDPMMASVSALVIFITRGPQCCCLIARYGLNRILIGQH